MKIKKTLIATISSFVFASAIIGGGFLAYTNANVDKLELLTRAVKDDKLNELKLARGDIKLAAGLHHASALIGNQLYMWGLNQFGQLGFGDTASRYTPTLLTNLPKGNITGLELGQSFSGVIIDGNAYTWGYNANYQLGLGDTINRSVPTMVPNYSNVSQLSFSNYHSGFISNSKIYMWGSNNVGQLGDNTVTNRSVPTPISFSNYSAVKLSLGGSVSGAIMLVNGRNQLYTWGYNGKGQLGVETGGGNIPYPVNVSSINNMNRNLSDISMGTIAAGAIVSGTLYTWGKNEGGSAGTGPIDSTSVTPIAILSNAISISYSRFSYKDVAICITQSGTYTFGFNQKGEAGTGNTNPVYTPSKLSAAVASFATMGGGFGMCILGGKLYTWGNNSSGQLGTGSMDYNINSPNIRNIYQTSTVSLNSANDPNYFRNDVVYNIIKNSDKVRSVVEGLNAEINLPNPGYPISNIVATGAINGSGRITLRIESSFPIINDITINGFKPVNNTLTTNTVPAGQVPLSDKTFNHDYIFDLIKDANADTTGTNSKLAKWVIGNYLTNKNTYTPDFPENTKITKVDNFQIGDDTSKGEVKFNITVDKYYKQSGTTLIPSVSTDPVIRLNNQVHLFGLPKPISLEDCTDPLTGNIAVLETQIEPQISADTFFSAVTGNVNGGVVTNKLLLSQYLNIRFIPVDAVITITRDQSVQPVPGILEEPVAFTFNADKYYLGGTLVPTPLPTQNISFVIRPKLSAIIVKQNIEAITSQITTGDALKLISSGNNIKTEVSKYLNFEHFPLQTFFSLGNQIVNKNVEGKLSLSVKADKYYNLSSFSYINQNQTFSNLEISGFKPAYSINDYPVNPTNETIKGIWNKTEFYDKIVQNNVVDRAFLSQFLDLRAVPTDAVLTITRMEYNNDNTIWLTVKSDRYYGTGGVTIFQSHEATALVKLPTVDLVLIVILVSAGLFIIFLIVCIVISIKNKNRIRITE